jgi:hypothetical protein
MKKLLFTIALLTVTALTFAQTINFGIRAGLNLSKQSADNANNYGASSLAGFNAGGIVDIGFKSFSIQPGVFFSTKGEKNTPEGENIAYKTTLNYIEVPVNLLYKSTIAAKTNIHFGGGPYIAYGLSENVTANGQPYSTNNTFNFKNPDYGVNFIAGLTLNHLIIDAGYGLGVANLLSQTIIHESGSSDVTIKNRVISLSVGYLFR